VKSKLKWILIAAGIILFYAVGIFFLRSIPQETRSDIAFSVFWILVIIFIVCLGAGSFLYRCGSPKPQNKKEKIGDALCNFAFWLRFVFVGLIPFFFAAVSS
jgi:hypothetical protein